MMDVDYVTQEFAKAVIENDETGLIPAFDVYLTKIYGDYYARISYEFERLLNGEVDDDPEVENIAKQLLIEAGHVCGFNTFGGIMKSEEWDAVVLPKIESQEDWVRGMVAVINVLGWGVYQIEELTPENLILTIENSYEADTFLRTYMDMASNPKCYAAVGISIALMSLVYHADISQKPALDEILYNKLFKDHRMFDGQEIECTAMGHEKCKIRVFRL